MGTFEEALARQAGIDPVTQALLAPLREAVRVELDRELPVRLTRTRAEAAAMLGLGKKTIQAMIADGVLATVGDNQRAPVTLASILEAAGSGGRVRTLIGHDLPRCLTGRSDV